MPFFHLKEAFFKLAICLILIFFSSCSHPKVAELLPDSSQILAKINLPNWAELALKNPVLGTQLNDFAGLDLGKTGVDFFQPAYFFLLDEKGEKQSYLLLGLSNHGQFQRVLEDKANKKSQNLEGGGNFLHGANFLAVWQEKVALVYLFSGLTGPARKPESLFSFLISKERPKGKDSLSDLGLCQFRGVWQEKDWLGPLADLDFSFQGSLENMEGNWELHSEVVEDQFTPLFMPFGKPQFSGNEYCQYALAMKAEPQKWKPILALFGEEELPPLAWQIIEQFSAGDYPLLIKASGCGAEELQENFQLDIPCKTEKEVNEFKKMTEKFGFSIFPNVISEPNSWLQVRMKKGPFFPIPAFEQGDKCLFFAKLKENQSEGSLEIKPGKGGGKINIHLKTNDLNWIQKADSLLQLPKLPI
jgi:hypothetical protein